MPKLRTSMESFMDAQRHITIGRARLDKDSYNQNIGKKLDTIMTLLTEVIASAEKESKSSFLNRDLNSAATKIEKELERNNIKIDYVPIVREMWAVDNPQKALKIGLRYGIERNEVVQLMSRAPIKTNLGKIMRELKAQREEEKLKAETAQLIPIKPPAAIQPEEYEEQNDNTIDSEGELDDNLKQLLGSGE